MISMSLLLVVLRLLRMKIMNDFAKKHKPTDVAPDWSDKMFGARVADSIMCLILFGALTEEEGKRAFDRMHDWFHSIY